MDAHTYAHAHTHTHTHAHAHTLQMLNIYCYISVGCLESVEWNYGMEHWNDTTWH